MASMVAIERFVLLVLACASAAAGRLLQQQGVSDVLNASMPGVMTSTGSTSSFPSFMAAVQAANTTTNLTTLVAAVEAAGVAASINDTTTWTILAPTNEAFDKRLTLLNLTAAQLLDPANKPLLVQILSYHVIPAGAIMSSNLTSGQNVSTALADGNLTVSMEGGNVTFVGPTNNATVVAPDIMAGASVIHVINDVLVPPMNATANATSAGEMPGMTAAMMSPTPAAGTDMASVPLVGMSPAP